MIEKINEFIQYLSDGNTICPASDISPEAEKIARKLLNVPGMTLTNTYDFNKSLPILKLKEGTVLKFYKNPFGVKHIFLANNSGEAFFAGFVGWIHSDGLDKAIKQICQEFSQQSSHTISVQISPDLPLLPYEN